MCSRSNVLVLDSMKVDSVYVSYQIGKQQYACCSLDDTVFFLDCFASFTIVVYEQLEDVLTYSYHFTSNVNGCIKRSTGQD